MSEFLRAAGLFVVFAAVVVFVQWAKKQSWAGPAFRYLPVPFWCYFLPMLASAAGLFPAQSPLYPFLSRYLLPLCLAMLLLNVDLPGLARVGRRALIVMAGGVAGIILGAVFSFALFHGALPAEAWKGVGALSGSWIGGSANMLALKEALAVPEDVFAPLIVVDTFLAYGWMAFLIFLAGFQDRFDAWNKAAGSEHVADERRTAARPFPWATVPAVALTLALGSFFVGDRLPPLGAVVTRATWTILVVTTAGLLLSLTGRFTAAPERTERWGNFLLYVLLVSMGARARLAAIWETPVFLLMGVVWMLTHGGVLFIVGRLARVPLYLLASASQACVGGPISAPLVTAVYRPALAPLGLLLAVLGNVLGTYLGLAVARVCAWVAS